MKTKPLLFLLLLLTATCRAAKISDYPITFTLLSNDVFIVERITPPTNFSIRADDLLAALNGQIELTQLGSSNAAVKPMLSFGTNLLSLEAGAGVALSMTSTSIVASLAPATFTVTNFVLGQLYTNGLTNAWVSASLICTGTTTKHSLAALLVDQDANGSFEITNGPVGVHSNAIFTTAFKSQHQLRGRVNPGGVFQWFDYAGQTNITLTNGIWER